MIIKLVKEHLSPWYQYTASTRKLSWRGDEYSEMKRWLNTNNIKYKSNMTAVNLKPSATNFFFRFKYECDAIMFKLMWG